MYILFGEKRHINYLVIALVKNVWCGILLVKIYKFQGSKKVSEPIDLIDISITDYENKFCSFVDTILTKTFTITKGLLKSAISLDVWNCGFNAVKIIHTFCKQYND